MFRFILALGGLVLSLALTAAEPGIRAQVVGGTLAGLKPKSQAIIDLTSATELTFTNRGRVLRVDYRKVNTLEYGQNASRRYVAAIVVSPVLLLSKSRKHFVTVGFVDDEGAQQAIVLRVDKGDIRSFLASLEARTGRRVEYQDDEARKAGK